MIRIAVDAMGGDLAPDAAVEGVRLALAERDDITVQLYGPAERVGQLVRDAGDRVEVVDAPELITNSEHPTQAIRAKTNSSIVKGLMAVKENRADAFLSAGSTGALLAGAIFKVGRIDGVSRPALAPIFPTMKDKPVLVCDIGANMDCKPDYLRQFAAMGAAYMRGVAGVDVPRVALLSVGTEDEKGNELTRAAFELLKDTPGFAGNMEARDVLRGDVDVVVTDGFAGNVFLKSVEGAAEMIMGLLKTELTSSLIAKLGAALIMPGLRRMKKKMDYSEQGGSPLLGVGGVVVKAHGSSNARAFRSAIFQAERMARAGLADEISRQLKIGAAQS